ncbi:antibiotic biosynthesis monooxygenase [Lysobacter sp. S4-A87]|uniref:antibiotic biosynthesis monooxygenase family protein n=1 Tax=Lysobacter sp. S4-A87 TaxID=2925843 RepID=UPI001F5357AC|nr:antibiotic biosynthesis monooxygenase [Lysobacter sp. S4-A87]UNK48765.1 antibiotic biosynthesis monooxygenase [Lysobacter sp. S4-A87]
MIARLWHGVTLREDAEEYLAFLRQRAVPDYRGTPGNVSVSLMHRVEGRLAHFLILTHWESLSAIEAFAGSDVTRAKYYPEDHRFLLEFEPAVVHYDVDGPG